MPRWYQCLNVTLDLDHILAVTNVTEKPATLGLKPYTYFDVILALRDKPLHFCNMVAANEEGCYNMEDPYIIHGARANLMAALK